MELKISILLPNLHGGGAERVNLDLAKEFTRQGYHVEFVLMQGEGKLLPEAQGLFSVVDLNVKRIRHVPVALARYLRNRKPNVLIASMWSLTVLAVIGRILSLQRCKTILVEHSVLSVQYASKSALQQISLRISTWLGYRLADACVGVSGGVANDMAKLSFLPTERFQVIHNPIPLKAAACEESIKYANAIWGDSNEARIISVGSFKDVKNYPLLLHAIAALLERQQVKLLLLGDGIMRDELEKLASNLGISEKVIMPGFHEDPTPFYQTADLFVLSSNREGLPTVLIEAMGCGLPVVSTDCPSGPAEILNNGEFGTLVPVNDAEKLAQAMEQALNTKHDPERLRARARDFAPEIAAACYIELFNK